MSRLEDALNLIWDELPKETKKILDRVLELDYEANYFDYNHWIEHYNDKSENGLKSYLRDLFGLQNGGNDYGN